MTAILERHESESLWGRFYNWITSTENRLYIEWFGVLMIPTLLIATFVFIIAFIATPPIDIDGIRELVFGYLLYENNIIYGVIIPTFAAIEWELSFCKDMRPWITVAYSAPVVVATTAEHNILMHMFHMLGIISIFGGSLFSAMFGSMLTSSLIRETTENESTNGGYRFDQEKEIYNIVTTQHYFGRLKYVSFKNSHSLHFS
ncbi:hypothetical protein ES319_D04G140000v1 [Gossypium barbadense]|uniref:Photosystem II protein D1 n=1 Tax=Gossypium barbadense TaxID=3634 RepID=A0A5J5RVY1_GOSBA|nr:hypothetical protein ES319_D04G140000v1 [Gossypium barbadense]